MVTDSDKEMLTCQALSNLCDVKTTLMWCSFMMLMRQTMKAYDERLVVSGLFNLTVARISMKSEVGSVASHWSRATAFNPKPIAVIL